MAPVSTRVIGIVSVLALLAGAVVLGAYLRSAPEDAPLPKENFALPAEEVPDPGETRPVLNLNEDRVVIPSLAVDAPLESGGVTEGLLELPDDVAHTALWDGSARLRARRGSVLVAGHLDNASQDAGALHDLSTIKPGAAVYLTHEGVATGWKVTALQATPKRDLPGAVWRGSHGPRRLYLVTCGGPIVGGHYSDNVIATAVPIQSSSRSARPVPSNQKAMS